MTEVRNLDNRKVCVIEDNKIIIAIKGVETIIIIKKDKTLDVEHRRVKA